VRSAVPHPQMLLNFVPLWLGLEKQLLKMDSVNRANLVGLNLHAWRLRMASVQGDLWQETVLQRTGDLWREPVLRRTGHVWQERDAPVQDTGAKRPSHAVLCICVAAV